MAYNQTNFQHTKRRTDTGNRLVVSKGRGRIGSLGLASQSKLLFMCITDSLRCMPETNTTLYVG